MSVLSTLLGNYGDDLAKAAGKVAAANTDDLARALAKGVANKADDETITLYRGLTQPYDKSFPVNRLDTSGYESWTDNLNLAKQYGDNVYSITVPKSDIKASYLDENPLSPTYGDRNPIYRIDKKAGLNGVSGNEFLLEVGSPYQEALKYNEVPNLAKQMFDESGNRIKFYHGTPSGGFDKFNDASYFTPNKWYADMYQNPQASSISYGKVADNPMTYETYLDIKKPFDLSDRKARDIYINDYIRGGNAVGINPYQSSYNDIKNIDWTEVENLVDFLTENNYDYDAIIADEGGFFDNSGKVVSRGKSYIPFSGSQVSILRKIIGSK